MPSDERDVKFHEVMRDLLERSKATVTHKKLASAIGVSSTTVSHYITGRIKPSFPALIRIAAFFNVSLDYLVFGERPPPAVEDRSSVRADVMRALIESNNYTGRQRDLIVRVNRRLIDEVERVAQQLLDDRENFGPTGFITDSEAMAIESCAVVTRVMIRTAPADVLIDDSGRAVPGQYFNTLVDNIGAGRAYQFLFYGRTVEYARYATIYRGILQEAGVDAQRVREGVEFRVVDAELPTGLVLHDLDLAQLGRNEPVLAERFREGGIVERTLAYASVRHEDALGGVVLYGTYFDSALRMFHRDWAAANIL